MFGARFDDAEAGRSFSLVEPLREIVAMTQSDVVEAIRLASNESANGKWVAGYVAYEAAPAFDTALVVSDDYDGPLVWFGVFGDEMKVEPPVVDPMAAGGFSVSRWAPTWGKKQFDRAFIAVREHIEHDDIRRVNLSFRIRAAFSGHVEYLYADLVAAQQPSYAAHVWHDDMHVLSVSPEQFFVISDRRITTRPMRGTARRGRWKGEDDAMLRSLVESEKERADNLMIVDLLRKDLGRITEPGSMKVDELLAAEKYQTVWQMASQISATLRHDVGVGGVFDALFPCGSVTGVPKDKSMEIISELEDSPRGVYCGAVGFIPPGDGIDGASFNVAIRTAVIDEREGVATYGVGGAITSVSEPGDGYDNALAKALILGGRSARVELIEAIRWDDGYLMLDEHLTELSESAAYWSMVCDIDSLRSMLGDLEETMSGPTEVRVVVSREGTVSLSMSEAPARFALGPGPADQPVHLCIDNDPLDSSNPRLFHKIADRKHFDDRRRRNADVDDVLCVNEHGFVTESTIANAAFLLDGIWVTPPITDGLLGGVMRQRLITEGVLMEQSVSIPEALAAEAVALVNAVRGWRPAVIDVPRRPKRQAKSLPRDVMR